MGYGASWGCNKVATGPSVSRHRKILCGIEYIWRMYIGKVYRLVVPRRNRYCRRSLGDWSWITGPTFWKPSQVFSETSRTPSWAKRNHNVTILFVWRGGRWGAKEISPEKSESSCSANIQPICSLIYAWCGSSIMRLIYPNRSATKN